MTLWNLIWPCVPIWPIFNKIKNHYIRCFCEPGRLLAFPSNVNSQHARNFRWQLCWLISKYTIKHGQHFCITVRGSWLSAVGSQRYTSASSNAPQWEVTGSRGSFLQPSIPWQAQGQVTPTSHILQCFILSCVCSFAMKMLSTSYESILFIHCYKEFLIWDIMWQFTTGCMKP